LRAGSGTTEEELKQASQYILAGLNPNPKQRQIRCEYMAVDLSDSEQVVALAAFALHTFGRVDILVRARNPNLQSDSSE
jgi:NAD(P)-dependent dehydrogenase (short-subunit alcohol dehydrogenase family)